MPITCTAHHVDYEQGGFCPECAAEHMAERMHAQAAELSLEQRLDKLETESHLAAEFRAKLDAFIDQMETARRNASRPPSADEVTQALQFARIRRDEHEAGKLTDPERFAVVLAKELKRIALMCSNTGVNTEAVADEFARTMERIIRNA